MGEINVKNEFEKNLNAFAEKETAKGTSSFKIVKNISKVIRPFAKVRHRQDIIILVDMLDDACDNQDRTQCEFLIAKLQEAAKNEALMPLRAMRQIAADIVNFKKANNETASTEQKKEGEKKDGDTDDRNNSVPASDRSDANINDQQ